MLRFSDQLLQAYALKEACYDSLATSNRSEAEHCFDFWQDTCDQLNLPEPRPFRKMFVNWRPYILNAFDIHLSNGFTEGCNNAIKTLKRLAFGFRNFSAFRARILLAVRIPPLHLTKNPKNPFSEIQYGNDTTKPLSVTNA